MAQLLIHNEKIIQIESRSFPVHEDLQWVRGTGNVGDSYINGQVIPKVIDEPAPMTWSEERIAAYRDYCIADQIDTIQKQLRFSADRGDITLTEETSNWLTWIDNIKTRYPKPTE